MTASNKLNVLQLISDDMQAVIQKSAELAPDAYDVNAGLDSMRTAYSKERAYWNEGGPEVPYTDAVITTSQGDVPVRFHTPTHEVSPAIIYIHGGGFILGGLDTHDRIMRILADQTGATVVGVDYSLSPEAKHPRALRECVELAQYLHTHGSKHGIDGDSISFAGDSGGAFLSLASYLYLKNEVDGARYIQALILYYGLYGLRDSVSRRLMGGTWDGLTEEDLAYYMDSYLADPADARSPYVDCLSADLSTVPPCFIAAAEYDPLIDDSAALAAVLSKHGLHHRYVVYAGVLHAFLHNSRHLDTAMDALVDGAQFFRDLVKNPQTSL
ncbi:MAG: acetyl esterase [Propionibacteriaceae bacterium]|jgi:acetyl esterase|nr:acetyl esterase [Propionibacteriaceae bacterium]